MAPLNPPSQGNTAATQRTETVSALERGIALLRCFSETRRVLTQAELSRLAGVPGPTVTRLATALVSLGLLQHDSGSEAYRLGPGVVSLARVFLAGLDVRAAAHPHMQMLADATGGSVYLAMPDGLEMVIIEVCRPHGTLLAPRLEVGSRVPMANSALGRACLWAQPPDMRRQRIESLRLAHGSDWPALEPGLRRALAEADRHGYTLSAGEFHREINSVSVPLLAAAGELLALNCGTAAFLHPEEHLRQVVAPQLLAVAHALAASIGGSVPPPHPPARRDS